MSARYDAFGNVQVRMRIAVFVSVFLIGAAAFPLSAQSADSAGDSFAPADAFLAQAEAAMGSGDFSRAGSLASSALDISPEYSEALYVEARTEAANRDSIRAAIDHLRAALRNNSWRRTDPVSAEQILTGLLIRTMQLADARKSAERLVALRPEDAANYVLLARLNDRAGNTAAAQRTLANALRLFPQNDELRLLFSRVLQRSGRSAEAAALVRTGLQLHPESPDLLLASAGLEIDRERKVAAIEHYTSAGGKDPLAAVLGMEAVPISHRKKYLDLFLASEGLSREELVLRALDAVKGSSSLTGQLRGGLSSYTGNRDLDADLDGTWDERWVFENGKAVRWVREPAEDGVAQDAAVFPDGRPVTLAARGPSGAVTTFTFSRYPFLEKADVPGEGTYSILPYTMQCVFLRPDFAAVAQGMAPRVLAKFTVPSAELLRRGSYQLAVFAADGVTVTRRVDLSGGQPVFMEESTAGDGVLDHRVWYSRGKPQRGARSLSRNADFRVTETWRNGQLAEETIDTHGNGVPDYRETYGPAPAKYWDFNGDGRYDSKETALPDGTLVREVSTRLNGVFDLKIVSRDARIVSFTREGAQVPIVADAARGVTWIGQPAPAAGKLDLTKPDSIQEISGMQFLVFRVSGIVYAEAVQE